MKPAIDTPDFEEALANDRDGSFHNAVQTFLDRSLDELHADMRRGLSVEDFDRARILETALQKAGRVVTFSRKIQPSNS